MNNILEIDLTRPGVLRNENNTTLKTIKKVNNNSSIINNKLNNNDKDSIIKVGFEYIDVNKDLEKIEYICDHLEEYGIKRGNDWQIKRYIYYKYCERCGVKLKKGDIGLCDTCTRILNNEDIGDFEAEFQYLLNRG